MRSVSNTVHMVDKRAWDRRLGVPSPERDGLIYDDLKVQYSPKMTRLVATWQRWAKQSTVYTEATSMGRYRCQSDEIRVYYSANDHSSIDLLSNREFPLALTWIRVKVQLCAVHTAHAQYVYDRDMGVWLIFNPHMLCTRHNYRSWL